MEETCQICFSENLKWIQICKCKDSKYCFFCLAQWRIQNEKERNYDENLEDWFSGEIRCDICKRDINYFLLEDAPKWKRFFNYMNKVDETHGCTMAEIVRRGFICTKVAQCAMLYSKNEELQDNIIGKNMEIRELTKQLAQKKKDKEDWEKQAFQLQQKVLELEEKMKKKKDIIRDVKKRTYDTMTSLLGEQITRHSKKSKEEIDENAPFTFTFPTVNVSELFARE
jgi:hypothetical protein